MFQVATGTTSVVQPQPARASFGAEASRVVADHLDALLGEQLLPVRMRQGDADEPYLLAVDAAGQPVVVEVVPVLDEAACTRALRHAGRAARLSTQDLARAYQGGPERFAEHVSRFRQTVPASALLSPSVRGGARLLLVCSEITPETEDIAEFLLQPGWQVEILQVGVIHDAEGRRIVDVSPLVRSQPSRRPLEPTSVVRPQDVPRGAGGAVGTTSGAQQQQQPWPSSRPHSQAHASSHGQPHVQLHTPGRGTSAPVAPPTRTPSLHRTGTASQPVVPAASSSASSATAWPAGTAWSAGRPAPAAAAPNPLPYAPAVSAPVRVPTIVPPPFAAAVRSQVQDDGRDTRDLGPVPATSASGAQDPGRVPASRDLGPMPPSPEAPYAFTGALAPSALPGARADARLVALAAEIGEPMALAWVRQRRGTRHDAVLTTDGYIELPDGSRHADPDSAAAAASGAEVHVDGWRAWRLEGDGPTLAEALTL